MKPMTHSLRSEIKIRIKNRHDISNLIKDVDIRGENLNRAIIKDFNAIHRDISEATFVDAHIGTFDKETHMNWCIAHNCCFKKTSFFGIVIIRNGDLRDSSFAEAYVPFVEYQHADLRGINFCDCIWRIGSRAGHGAKVDKNMFIKWGLKLK